MGNCNGHSVVGYDDHVKKDNDKSVPCDRINLAIQTVCSVWHYSPRGNLTTRIGTGLLARGDCDSKDFIVIVNNHFLAPLDDHLYTQGFWYACFDYQFENHTISYKVSLKSSEFWKKPELDIAFFSIYGEIKFVGDVPYVICKEMWCAWDVSGIMTVPSLNDPILGWEDLYNRYPEAFLPDKLRNYFCHRAILLSDYLQYSPLFGVNSGEEVYVIGFP